MKQKTIDVVLDESVDGKCNLDLDSDDEDVDKDLNKTLQSEISKINDSLALISTLMKKKKSFDESVDLQDSLSVELKNPKLRHIKSE